MYDATLVLLCVCTGVAQVVTAPRKPAHQVVFTNEVDDSQTMVSSQQQQLSLRGHDQGDYIYALLGHPYDELATKAQFESYTRLAPVLRRHGLSEKSCVINADMVVPDSNADSDGKPGEDDPFQARTAADAEEPKARWKQAAQHKQQLKQERQLFSVDQDRPLEVKSANAEAPVAEGIKEAVELDDFDLNAEPEEQQHSYFGTSDWLRDYGQQELSMSYEQPRQLRTQHFDAAQVMGYSWHDCVHSSDHSVSTCFNVLQIRNYAGAYPHNVTADAMDGVHRWIRSQTQTASSHNRLTLIVFQAFDTSLEPIVQRLARRFKLAPTPVMAVLFALMEKCGPPLPERNICDAVGRRIPVVRLCDLHPDEYLMMQFSPQQITRLMAGRLIRPGGGTQLREIDFHDRACYPV